jgi:hypothetical protein
MRANLVTICICFAFASLAFAQDWREYRLSNYDGQFGVGETAAVLDGGGNVHVYYSVIHMCSDSFYQCNDVMYMKVSPYGRILDGPVRVDDSTVTDQRATGLRAVGDGQSRSWAIWDNSNAPPPPPWGAMYMAGRDSSGAELLPVTFLGRQRSNNLGDPDVDAAFDPRGQTIVRAVAGVGDYSQFTLSGDTVCWMRRFPDSLGWVSDYMSTAVAPDSAVWAVTRYSNGQPAYLAFERIGSNGEISERYPFGHTSGERWGLYDLAIDQRWNFHCLVYHDSAQLSYVKLDSALQLQEWHTLRRPSTSTWASIEVDASEACLVIWLESTARDSLKWALRDSTGRWVVDRADFPGRLVGDWPYSIGSPQAGRWLAVFAGVTAGNPDHTGLNLYLASYGYPPDAVPVHSSGAVAEVTISLSPNPFTSAFTINPIEATGGRFVLYNLIGQEVYSQVIPTGVTSLQLASPTLSNLPSGTYFGSVQGRTITRLRQPIIHLR